MAEKDTITFLAEEIASAFEPLSEAIASPENFIIFMLQLGWDMREIPKPIKSLAIPLQNILNIVESGEVNASKVASLISSTKSLINSINQISNQPDNLFPATVDANELKREFPSQMIQFLIIEYLLDHKPRYGSLLKAMGIIRIEEVPATSTRPAYVSLKLAWEDLANIFEKPFVILTNAYKWGSPGFKADQVLENVWDLAKAFDIDIHFDKLEPVLESFLTKDAILVDDAQKWALRVPIIEDRLSGIMKFGICLFMLPRTATDEGGLSIIPYGSGGLDEQLELSENLTLQIEAAMNLAAGIALLIRPEKGIKLLFDIISSIASTQEPPSSDSFSIALKTRGGNDSKTVLIGSNTGSRLEFSSISTKGGVRVDSAGDIDAYVEFKLEDGGITIKPGDDADSFLSSLLPEDGFSNQFGLTVGFSTRRGFYFAGGSGLEVTIPAHLNMGLIEIVSSTIAIKTDSEAILINIGATLKGNLGPLTAVVENMGLRANFTFPSDYSGNLGPVDLNLGFQPPKGVGLAIDAAGISGGGFLKHDDAKHEYSGVLQLEFDTFALQAFGVIATQVAGRAGYSLLALIDSEFPPVQLGWGFTLNGVGGLFAVNRSASTDALRAALKAGTLSSILFPKNAISNAPQILSTLDTLFPTAAGRFIFAPMALIGWGTPTLLTAAVAVVLELPEPIRIILIARISACLPSQSEALVRINVVSLGILDLSQDSLSLDATLFDSRLLSFTLSGDLALRANWGVGPHEFLLAMGGFHPQFTPPPGFPALQRITIDMPSGTISKLRLTAYLAITSNTVQFGASIDAFIGAGGYGLSGHLGFDALFQLDPFHFDADISGQVSLVAGGDDLMSVALNATLSGPAPWHIAGNFSVHLIFFNIGVSFSHTWGGDAPAQQIAPVDPLPLLMAAFADIRNWGAALLPDATSALVSLSHSDVSIVHPLARLEVHESVVPLGVPITRFGSAPVAGSSLFTISGYQVNASNAPHETIQDDFAPAQFFDLGDDEAKLAAPSFERHDAGVRLTGGLVSCGPSVLKTTAYETYYVDQPGAPLRTDPGTPKPLLLSPTDLAAVLAIGSSGCALIRSAGNRRYSSAGTPIMVTAPAFLIANRTSLDFSGIGSAAGTTYTEAGTALATALTQDPGRGTEVQIITTHEFTRS